MWAAKIKGKSGKTANTDASQDAETRISHRQSLQMTANNRPKIVAKSGKLTANNGRARDRKRESERERD